MSVVEEGCGFDLEMSGFGSTGLEGCPGSEVLSMEGSAFGIDGDSSQPAMQRMASKQVTVHLLLKGMDWPIE